jgi:hypothetical protein
LASASPYLSEHFANDQAQNRLENVVTFKLNGGFDKNALQILVDYAYTAKLDVQYNQVGVFLKANDEIVSSDSTGLDPDGKLNATKEK